MSVCCLTGLAECFFVFVSVLFLFFFSSNFFWGEGNNLRAQVGGAGGAVFLVYFCIFCFQFFFCVFVCFVRFGSQLCLFTIFFYIYGGNR